MSSSKSDSVHITDKKVSHGCNMQLMRWFLTIWNYHSPEQFVSIMVKYIHNTISMSGYVDYNVIVIPYDMVYLRCAQKLTRLPA